jgi:undecaprenyl-diphosphatase
LIDVPLSAWLHARPDPLLIQAMLFVSHWHSTIGLLLMAAAAGALLWRAGERWWLLSLLLTVPGGMLLNVAVKHIVQRQRPHFDDALVHLTSYSFPSGHVAGSTVLYGFAAAYLLSRVREPRLRIAIVAAAAAMVLLVGFSRMYLGAHYLSDVVGAVVEGLLWVWLCQAGIHALRRRRDHAPA